MAKPARPRRTDPAVQARAGVVEAVQACDAKKAADITLLELEKGSGAFTDYFVICSGSNPRQIQAISDEVEQRLSRAGLRPSHVEGYSQAEWVLLDYVDFVVHVFSEGARKFYDLERLWKSARRLSPAEMAQPARPQRTQPAARRRRSNGRMLSQQGPPQKAGTRRRPSGEGSSAGREAAGARETAREVPKAGNAGPKRRRSGT